MTMRRLAINPNDSRCEPATPISVYDLADSNRIISQHSSATDAMRAKAALMYDRNRRFGDRELQRFRIDNQTDALRSLADVYGRQLQWQYTRPEWVDIVDAVRSAVAHFTGVVAADDSIEWGPLDDDDEQPEDLDDDHDDPDDADDPDDDDWRLRDGTPYSTPYVTLVSNRGLPSDGEYERRSRPWIPATPADRRQY